MQHRVNYLKELNQREANGELDRLPKKEAALLRHEQQNLANLIIMMPINITDIAIVVDPSREGTAIAECQKLGMTIISIVDTNCDPDMVDMPIPANDDADKASKFC